MPLGRAKIPDRYPIGEAASREQTQQRVEGISQLYAGAGGFRTGPRALEQQYVAMRFRIGPGRGANSPGGVAGAATTATDKYKPKSETLARKLVASRRG